MGHENEKKKIILFKVDFDKDFDSLNWEYLDSVFSQMGFGSICVSGFMVA